MIKMIKLKLEDINKEMKDLAIENNKLGEHRNRLRQEVEKITIQIERNNGIFNRFKKFKQQIIELGKNEEKKKN
jgi:predicted nuclease with TOPRIM domain